MFERVGATLERYMDLLSARQRIVASNLANADTPGYRARDLEFQAEFQSFLAKAPPLAREVTGLKSRNDGNNVSVDREARLLAENAMRFSLASAMARAEVRTIRNAIQEGRGG